MKPGQGWRSAAADSLNPSSSVSRRRRTSRFRLGGRVPPSQSTDPWSFLRGMHFIVRSGLRDPGGIDHLSAATKPTEYIMKFDSRAAAMLALAGGLLVAALGAGANEPARPQPIAERTGTDSARVQPTAKQFALPNRPDVGASDARTVDAPYRPLIGPQPATASDSRSSPPTFGAAPRDDAAGSVRRWGAPRWG
jgi:hypothetical protein